MDVPNWEGVDSGTEHRTVGPHRAWCYQDAEWCYPIWGTEGSMLCHCCDQTKIPKKWQGLNVSTVLEDLRQEVALLPHESHCSATGNAKVRGECDCLKSRVLVVLNGGEEEVKVE